MWHQDEPVGGTSVYAQWCVMRAARQAGVPVLLDGQGGDEILCGYRKFYIFYLWQLLRQGNPGVLREGIAWYRNVDTGFWNWTAAKRYAPSFGGNRRSLLARVCNPELAQECRHLPRAAIGPGQDLRRRQKDDLARYSLPALLHYEDRNSMAHSVEARVPLLDYQLAEFTVNCRPNLKLREGWTKWMLRQALKGRLPEPVRLRRSKLGFATPQKDWLRQDLRGTILALIHEPKLTMGRILSMTKIRGELEDFLNAKSGCLADAEAFRILNLELWARMFDVV